MASQGTRPSTTRLLILGMLMSRPLNGYEVRRELELWQAADWANIAYGSIYFGLKKMAEEGLLEVVDTTGDVGTRGATVYSLTGAGRQEFHRLLAAHWWDAPTPKDPLVAAFTFAPHMETGELLAALRYRAGLVRARLEVLPHLEESKTKHGGRHVGWIMRYAAVHLQAQLSWLEESIDMVQRGELP